MYSSGWIVQLHILKALVDLLEMALKSLAITSFPIFRFVFHDESAETWSGSRKEIYDLDMDFRTSKLSLDPIFYQPVFIGIKSERFTIWMRIDSYACGRAICCNKFPLPFGSKSGGFLEESLRLLAFARVPL